jgi:aspartate aminotransferase
MADSRTSQRTATFQRVTSHVMDFLMNSEWARRQGSPGISDFVVGNPHELPLASYVDALQAHATPHNPQWFAYKLSEPSSQQTVAQSLRQWRGVPFEPDDIHMTNGGFAAITVALAAVTDPGDEVIFVSPPWFFYEGIIAGLGSVPVRVRIDPQTFDLDLDAIAAAITPRTRAIIVNSPNNPTGKIYPAETLERLASVLTAASERNGRTIYLLSDEAYSRIVYDGRAFPSPTSYYADSFLLYTYGKTLLTPGQRIGFIALPPQMRDREAMGGAVMAAQVISGFAFPNALLQHALADLDKLSIDIEHLQHKRDKMVDILTSAGYELHAPDGTFYLLPKSPLEDDMAFLRLLAEQDIFVLPGAIVEMPGYFRISLTATEEMIDRAASGFAEARRRALTGVGAAS